MAIETPSPESAAPRAAWHPDPVHHHELRWWDGRTWTDHVADGSTTATDPLTPPTAEGPDVRAIVARHRGSLDGGPVFLAPHVPERRLAGALGGYARGVDPADVVVLVDSSLRGNGKTGMVLTGDRLVAHEVMQTRELGLDELGEVSTSGSRLRVDGTDLVLAGSTETAEALAALLRDLAGAHPATAVTAPPVAPSGELVRPQAVGETTERSDDGPADRPPRLGTALGHLAFGALLGAWPVIAAMTMTGDDCERNGWMVECVSQGGSTRVETTIALPLVAVLALLAVANLLRGFVLLAGTARTLAVRRVVAWSIDAAGWLVLAGLLAAVVPEGSSGAAAVVSLTGLAVYFTWGNATGQTLGRRLLDVAVVRHDRRGDTDAPLSMEAARAAAPGWAKGALRTLVGCSSIVYLIAHLWALWNAEDRTLGDLAAGTSVVAVAGERRSDDGRDRAVPTAGGGS
ncbi:MAG TPA: DUF2510 domain-containing protein [Acidimicrobiales bacterium]|nr:DUF2510 domain-containing protein [Acidimicrobiales bacterium]